ncbi:DUF2989 domain-containing protein [Ferrimonas lipolytica]|uniref:DUF2989 domain-containing protein n=1 Tax=Ferrimonas lipolytica TaxID=2724191 RepID=A0A6H1UCQ8_9GAMM|nr:DUF2989 domain-containing protein [Ferrimonas lipolytica]QIZ76628.1 DUF2989 domain-containing protein [Ferrimonas lipolytica]
MKYSFVALATVVVLTACQPQLNSKQICADNPQLCADIDQKRWCRRPRSELVHTRYMAEQMPSATNTYQLLIDTESYQNCMATIADMVAKPGTNSNSNSTQWYLRSIDTLENLQKQTETDPDPLLSLYHWARSKDPAAKQRFLAAESAGKVIERKAKHQAAVYFLKNEPAKAHGYVMQLLSNYEIDQENDKELLDLSALSYLKNNLQEEALVMMIIGNSPQIAVGMIGGHFKVSDAELARFEQEADKVRRLLNKGNFEAEHWKL